MKHSISADWSRVIGPEGLDLLRRYLAGDQLAKPDVVEIFDSADAGQYDSEYAGCPDPKRVHVTTSCHLMVLALLNRINGLTAA